MESQPDFRDVNDVVQLLHGLRSISATPDALTKEVERILGATAPEDEFMAIATWSGKCSLIHKLPPDKYPAQTDKLYKIPDLFAVFEYEGRSIATLVEVKSTYTKFTGKSGRMNLAKFSPSYRKKLQAYGDLLGLPVLIAQQIRPGGIWFLVALETVGLAGKPKIDFAYDLSGLLLGVYSMCFKSGIKFVLNFERMQEISEHKFEAIIRDAYWATGDGKRMSKTSSPMMLLFGLGDPLESQHEEGTSVIMEWEIPGDNAFFNYQALRAAAFFDEELKGASYPWKEMLRSGRFPIERENVDAARQDAEFFTGIITTRPKEIPSFLQ